MTEFQVWDDLARREQRLIIKLFGGGSLRNEPTDMVDELRARGLINETGLTPKGFSAFIAARRRQQAIWRE